jgi:hypothetical protein
MYTKQNPEYKTLNFFGNASFSRGVIGDPRMKTPSSLKCLLKQHGYSEKSVEEIWKWYDFSKRKGAASF